ncbi:MAG: glycosyltransferase family 4 protein [Burkholderiaceae bacterium]
MKFAYFGIPHTGGTYTVYHSLRVGLATQGITVKWLGLGTHAQAAYHDPQWKHERDHGVVIAGQVDDERKQAEALIRYLESADFDGVFVNVLAGRVETNAIRYLDPAIKRVMIVHSITPGTYAAARAVRDHVHATIGVSPRIRNDLIRSHGFKEACTHAIPNAIDLKAFNGARVERQNAKQLRLLFLGRVVDTDKGVFWLPQIMAKLSPDVAHLTVVGDGSDMAELQKRCAGIADRITFTARIASHEVPDMLACHDVFIFPSRFEGLGLSLVEAMAGGCVPVATRIKDVTTFVVKDGINGFLFDMGDTLAAASAITRLADEPALLRSMSAAAQQNAAGRFALSDMAGAYKAVLEDVHLHPSPISKPFSMDQWAFPSGLTSNFRSKLPSGLKNVLRSWREKLA